MSARIRSFEEKPKRWWIEHLCIQRARAEHAKAIQSPLWREHFNYRVIIGSTLVFRGSYDACDIARQAFPMERYRVVDCAGAIQMSNYNPYEGQTPKGASNMGIAK